MSGCVLACAGERFDPVGGMYLPGRGARGYRPALMRFAGPDALSPFGAGGVNPYAYCDGDPVNRADPSGHFSVGGAVGLGLGLLGVLLTPLSFGTTLAAALSIGAVVAGIASVGLGVAAEVIDDRKTAEILGWSSLAAGIASCMAPKAEALVGALDRKLGTWLQRRSGLLGRIERGERGAYGYALGGRLGRCLLPAAEPETAPGETGLAPSPLSMLDMRIVLALPERQRPLIAIGTQGAVYGVGSYWVVKAAMQGVHELCDSAALQCEADIFNRVYGAGAAWVVEDMLWMRKIPGRPVGSLDLSGSAGRAMGRKIVAELRRLSAMGISHGDPHWDNVLVDDRGIVRFVDFGKSVLRTPAA
ncbi:RHS repeat-associated core domain-containing protein [Chromobacterium sp. CV08]|uniref:RHS repeat-associated core domain-containing protein n=1 Tax=Chromobacterium sp. CV08 TaxID=3133274 RepID=UPI003DA83AF4